MDMDVMISLAAKLQQVWGEIGYDVLGSETAVMDRDSVFCVAVDIAFGHNDIPRDLWLKLSDEEREQVKMIAFPRSLYCI